MTPFALVLGGVRAFARRHPVGPQGTVVLISGLAARGQVVEKITQRVLFLATRCG